MAPQPVGPKAEVRLPAELLATVDSRAAAAGHSRAAELRHLIEAGMGTVPAASPQRGCTGRCEEGWQDAAVVLISEDLADAKRDVERYRSAMRIEKGEVIARQRRIEALEAELAATRAARDLAEALLAKSKSERGATSADRRDGPDPLDLLRSCIPHLPPTRLRTMVQEAVRR